MKYLLLLLLSLVPLKAQAVINDFSATVKGVTIGNSHCYFWINSPINGEVQIACYYNPSTGVSVILYNSVLSVSQSVANAGTSLAVVGGFPLNDSIGSIAWVFYNAPVVVNGVTTSTEAWTLYGQGPNDTVPVSLSGVF